MKGFIEVHVVGEGLPLLLNISQIISVDNNGIFTMNCGEDEWFEVQESYDNIKQLIEEAQQ